MSEKANILFVCTGNIFRSLTAHYSLIKYLKENNINRFNVSSAGIVAKKQNINSTLYDELKKNSIEPKNHIQRKLTKKIIEKQDLIICMSLEHQKYIRKHFNTETFLFNEFAKNEKTSVKDIDDLEDTSLKSQNQHIKFVVKYIIQNTKKIYEIINLKCFLFVDLIEGRRNHKNDLPFKPIYQTQNTIAFMGINIPQKEDGHILVIPKKRYKCLEKVPIKIQTELLKTIKILGNAIKQNHESYNILLNNGISAGQYIFHLHYHLIPRNPNDNIEIEVWENQKLNKQKFIDYTNKMIENVNMINNKQI